MSNSKKNTKIIIIILIIFLVMIMLCGCFLLGILLTLKFVAGGDNNPFSGFHPFQPHTTEETTEEPSATEPDDTKVAPTEEPGLTETESEEQTGETHEAKETPNALNGLTLVANDGSVLTFDGNDFSWVLDPENEDDAYYTGSYKLYAGEEAKTILLTDYKNFDITDSELSSTFETWPEENLRVLVLSTTEAKVDGKKLGEFDTVYYSFFDESKDDRFVLINMNEALVVTLEKQ